MAYNGRN